MGRLAASGEAAGQKHRADDLASECLRVVPNHAAARALLTRVRARAMVGS